MKTNQPIVTACSNNTGETRATSLQSSCSVLLLVSANFRGFLTRTITDINRFVHRLHLLRRKDFIGRHAEYHVFCLHGYSYLLDLGSTGRSTSSWRSSREICSADKTQIQPLFVTQRSLYEVRERPSKAYSWVAFIISNVIVEIPYQIVTGILIYACFYYPVVGIQSSARQGLVLLFIIQLFIYASSFAQMTIAALPDAQTASAIVTLLTMMITIFNGVLQTPDALPGFWIFMYRVSPFTYWIGGIVSTELHGKPVQCAEREVAQFNPPSGQTCGRYLAPFLEQSPGYLENSSATSDCRYCSISVADQYLAGPRIFYSERWRNYGIVWAFVAFNIFVAVASYYLVRVKKWNKGSSSGRSSFKIPFLGKGSKK